MMKKAEFLYKAIYRNPGRLSGEPNRNNDLYWQGKHSSGLNIKISQTFSTSSYELARRNYLIGVKANQKIKL
jgi:hypothetical protein